MEIQSRYRIGNIVRDELKRQGKTVAWLAEQLNMPRSKCYSMLRPRSINTDILHQICNLLQRDFFDGYAMQEVGNGRTMIVPDGVEFMQAFERKNARMRMQLIRQEDGNNEILEHYSFFYKSGYVDCYAGLGNRYIELGLRRVDSLPYTHEVYAASLNICNELQRKYGYNRFIVFRDEEKDKIYFDIVYDSGEISTFDQMEEHIEFLLNCVYYLRGEVGMLREKIRENGSMPLDAYLQLNS